MYVYPDKNGIAVFATDAPNEGPYWEADEVPEGSGICMIDPNGQIYWTGTPSEPEILQESPVESAELLVNALIE